MRRRRWWWQRGPAAGGPAVLFAFDPATGSLDDWAEVVQANATATLADGVLLLEVAGGQYQLRDALRALPASRVLSVRVSYTIDALDVASESAFAAFLPIELWQSAIDDDLAFFEWRADGVAAWAVGPDDTYTEGGRVTAPTTGARHTLELVYDASGVQPVVRVYHDGALLCSATDTSGVAVPAGYSIGVRVGAVASFPDTSVTVRYHAISVADGYQGV